MRRLARLLAVGVLVGSASLFNAGSASATALSLSQCTTTANVILAVDFSHWGGPLLRSCGSTPTTGYTLLNQGGWASAGTVHDGPAFICRIGYSGYNGGTQYPTPSTEACNLTPPASAYWSYWHANPGQNTWSYSQLGAMSYKPVAGSVDLWIYGGTNIAGTEGTPQFSPDSVRAHNTSAGGTTSKPAPPPATKPGGSGSSGGSSGTGSGGSSQAGSGAGSSGRGSSSSGSAGAGSTGTGTSGGAGSSGGTSASRMPAARTSAHSSLVSGTPKTSVSCSPSASAAPHSTAPTTNAASPSTSKAKPTATASPCATASTSAAAGSASSPSSGPRIVDAQPAADIKHNAGSFVPELVAGAILVVLGAFTGVRFWLRKQANQTP